MRKLPEDATFHARWLLTICAALGIAFLFAIASSSCAERDGREPQLPKQEVSGAELPSYEDGESQLGEQPEPPSGVARRERSLQ